MKLSEDAAAFALRNVAAFGDTDLLPLPIEYRALASKWDQYIALLTGWDLGSHNPRPKRQCLSPKRSFGFRIATQLDPIEHLLATGITYEIADQLESSRLPVDENRVHSYRFEGQDALLSGRFFSSEYTYSSFHRASTTSIEDRGPCWVVTADVADFYSRLYLHPLENALELAVSSAPHRNAILRLIKSWNQNVSYGIPVGPAFSRLLSEAAISDIDHLLLADGYDFFRFSDDFRIICTDQKEGYEALRRLAEYLYFNHGLTLNSSKTEVLPGEVFLSRWTDRSSRPGIPRLHEELESILHINVELPFYIEELAEHDLPDDVLRALIALDLPALMSAELGERSWPEPDYPVVRFLLSKLPLVQEQPDDSVLDNADRLGPIAQSVSRYLATYIDGQSSERVISTLLRLVDDPAAGTLEHNRAWWLSPLSGGKRPRGLSAQIHDFWARYPDSTTRTACLAVAAREDDAPWLRQLRRRFDDLGAWERRALIGALRPLGVDERRNWLRAVGSGLDPLEKVVASWINGPESQGSDFGGVWPTPF